MKQKGFAPIFTILGIVLLVIIGYFGYKYLSQNKFATYNNSSENFSLEYPKNWYVSELGKDVLTSRGTYFSSEKIDFTNSNYSAPKGFVRISVYDTKEMFRTPKYANKTYTSAQELLGAMQQEETENKGLPTTPGPPTLKGKPEKQFLDEAISVNDIQALGDRNFMYWVVEAGKLYEFLTVYPVEKADIASFDKNVGLMTSTFKINP